MKPNLGFRKPAKAAHFSVGGIWNDSKAAFLIMGLETCRELEIPGRARLQPCHKRCSLEGFSP
jgi:hypothetical protein